MCYIIMCSVTALVLYDIAISETKNWNTQLEQNAEELYEDGWCTWWMKLFSFNVYRKGSGNNQKKQSKAVSEQERSLFSVQTKTILDILIVN